MIVYLSAVLLSLFLANTTIGRKGLVYKRGKFNHQGLWLTALPFILVACLRRNVGTDYNTYTQLYSWTVPNGLYTVEPLFSLLIKFCVNVLNNPHMIVVVLGIGFCIFMFGFIYRYTQNINLSILFFFLTGSFNYSLNIMRQMFIVAVFFYVFHYIEERKPIRYFTTIAICFLIHKTAIIFVPFYFIYHLKLNNRVAKMVPIVSYALAGVVRTLIMLISARMNLYIGYFSSQYDTNTMSFSLLAVNLVSYYAAIYYMAKNETDNRYVLLFNIQLIAVCMSEWISVIPNGERMAFMFIPVQCVLLPNIIVRVKKRNRLLMQVFMIAVYGFFFVSYFFIKNYGETFPYSFI